MILLFGKRICIVEFAHLLYICTFYPSAVGSIILSNRGYENGFLFG